MTREEFRDACARAADKAVDKYRVAMQDNWDQAKPRFLDELMDELEAINKQFGGPIFAPEGQPEPPKPATTPRRARK